MLSHRQLFQQHLAQTTDFPLMLEIERAEGVTMYGPAGKEYIDLISGIAVSNIGHAHPAVTKAVEAQMKQYSHLMVYGELIQSPQVQYAQLLTSHLPGSLESVYFVNSGSEANEGALKLAKRYTGRPNIVAFHHAYHGSTQGALSIIGHEQFRTSFRPLIPGIRHVAFNEMEALAAIDDTTACVTIETIQAEAGVRVPSQEFMTALRNRCTETGTLLILDEIQAGMGRTGKLFGLEHYNIVPDIITLAKAFGGGLPLGAFIASKEVMRTLASNPLLGHITTFGGNAVCCTAGMAAFQVILNDKLHEQAEEKAQFLRKYLVHPAIKEIRNKGLLMAVEFESFEFNKAVIDRAIEKGVLTDWFLFADRCLRIAPPLVIDEGTIKKACDIILESIEEAASD